MTSSRHSTFTAHQITLDTHTSSRRHGYSCSTPTGGISPPSPSSPLSLPPLLPSDENEDDSPATTSVLVTPISTGPVGNAVKISSDHSLLSSLAQLPTPTFGSPGEEVGPRHHFPLLPPHHPLRKKLYATFDREGVSPPHTPKGHPIEVKSHFPFNAKHIITNPYATSHHVTLPRIPRRFRPFFLVGFCILTFGLLMLNNAMSRTGHLATRQMTPRRYVEIEGLMGINERGKHASPSSAAARPRMEEAASQSAFASTPEMLKFDDTRDELAALISFVTSTTANVLPSVDPTVPLDPSILLDFDPSRPSARGDLDLLVTEMNTIFPVVVMGKMRDPWLREVKKMLAEYKITPAPLMIDVDQRRDQSTFIPLMARLLGTPELPQLLLQGKSLGSYHDVLALRDAGTFRSTLEASGAVSVRDAKKKKKGVKERERIENERVLGPAPIVDAE